MTVTAKIGTEEEKITKRVFAIFLQRIYSIIIPENMLADFHLVFFTHYFIFQCKLEKGKVMFYSDVIYSL